MDRQQWEAYMAWITVIRQKAAALKAANLNIDPWLLPLSRVRGKIDCDGIERITTQVLLDILEVPQRVRKAGTYRRLAKLMAELGWTAVRVRERTRGGYLENIRGYCRDNRHGSAAPH
jgi:hypothetical protein